ncbi:MAG: hypothetical protein RBR86_08325 [Pseudobdellovibrionaceae bacterium]|nr:hypothetical protein [Pseudobdellovibrionaceae bacterium]
MPEDPSKRDHTLADRRYLRGYISGILGIKDGAYQLANMISNAESAAELLNYDREHIHMATQALLRQSILGSSFDISRSGIGKFAKTLRNDPDLYDAFTSAFGASISDTLPGIKVGEQSQHNLEILRTLVKDHPKLKGAWDVAISAEEKARETIKKAAHAEPTHRHPV